MLDKLVGWLTGISPVSIFLGIGLIASVALNINDRVTIASKDRQISGLQNEVAGLNGQISTRNEELANKDRRYNELVRAIAEADAAGAITSAKLLEIMRQQGHEVNRVARLARSMGTFIAQVQDKSRIQFEEQISIARMHEEHARKQAQRIETVFRRINSSIELVRSKRDEVIRIAISGRSVDDVEVIDRTQSEYEAALAAYSKVHAQYTACHVGFSNRVIRYDEYDCISVLEEGASELAKIIQALSTRKI